MTNNVNIATQSRRRRLAPSAAVLVGTVTKVGYYGDTLPKLIITVKKEEAEGIPFKEGERVSLPFIIHGNRYTAGVRTTERSTTVMICPDLNPASDSPARLVDVLLGEGMTQSRVELLVGNGAILVV